MTLFIQEFSGIAARMRGSQITPTPIKSYSLTSAASTGFSAGVEYIGVQSDVGSIVAITTSTGATLGSTNSYRIPPNLSPVLIAVSTAGRFLMGQST